MLWVDSYPLSFTGTYVGFVRYFKCHSCVVFIRSQIEHFLNLPNLIRLCGVKMSKTRIFPNLNLRKTSSEMLKGILKTTTTTTKNRLGSLTNKLGNTGLNSYSPVGQTSPDSLCHFHMLIPSRPHAWWHSTPSSFL